MLKRKTQHSQHHFVVFNIYVAVNIKQFFFAESRSFLSCVSYFLQNLTRLFALSFSLTQFIVSMLQPMLCTTFFIGYSCASLELCVCVYARARLFHCCRSIHISQFSSLCLSMSCARE